MNTVETVWHYFMMYGYYFLFLIVFLEYLNFPGLPAGIIMPAAGDLGRQPAGELCGCTAGVGDSGNTRQHHAVSFGTIFGQDGADALLQTLAQIAAASGQDDGLYGTLW